MRITSGGAVVLYNGGGQEYGMSTGRGTVTNTAHVVVKYYNCVHTQSALISCFFWQCKKLRARCWLLLLCTIVATSGSEL